jgi:membrane protein DedA with SNARE-associated domain
MVAGASDLEYPRFAAFAYCGAFTWVSTFLLAGYFVGEKWESTSEQFHRVIVTGSIGIGVILGLYLLVRWILTLRRN